MINTISYKLDKLSAEDKKIEYILNLICNFVKSLPIDYMSELSNLDSTTVRFCDFYDSDMFHGEEIIKYFNDNYSGRDKDKLVDVFAIYVILKNAQDFVCNYENFDTPEELYELLDCNNYFENILAIINYLNEKRLEEENKNELGFLDKNNKYQILFTGLIKDDLKKLGKNDKNIVKAFIKKISSQLSTSDCVALTECIDHVKSKYDFPIFRVHLPEDYRIAYIRKNNVTAILGVSIKTGRDLDYTRNEFITENRDSIYEEMNLLSNGILPDNSEHFEVINYLLKLCDKEKNNVKL